MKISTNTEEIEMENDDGHPVNGLRVTCDECQHSVEVFGTGIASARRGCVMLRDECPNKQRNFYETDWTGE